MPFIMAILGFLITLFTVLFYAQRIGLDFRDLNPFAWKRRRNFRKKYDGEPLYKLTEPLDAAGALITMIIKVDGDMSSVEKATVLGLFKDELKLDDNRAQELLAASSHLLGNASLISHKVGDILRPSLKNFSKSQTQSVVQLMEKAANAEGEASTEQLAVIQQAKKEFARV